MAPRAFPQQRFETTQKPECDETTNAASVEREQLSGSGFAA